MSTVEQVCVNQCNTNEISSLLTEEGQTITVKEQKYNIYQCILILELALNLADITDGVQRELVRPVGLIDPQ